MTDRSARSVGAGVSSWLAPVFQHRNYQRFIVLGRSRVGSNLLRGLLNAHRRCVTYGEIFRDVTSVDWDHLQRFDGEDTGRAIAHDPVAFLDESLWGRYPRRIRAVGFKLFYYHARDASSAAIWPYLRGEPSLKIVHLKRRNLLQTHLSRKRAALTDRWVSTSPQPDGTEALHLDYEECRRDFEQTRAWEEAGDREFASHAMITVEYERLAAENRSEIRKVQEFLRLDPQPVAPSTFQQARRSLSSQIANYEELKERFAGTPWAEFFTD